MARREIDDDVRRTSGWVIALAIGIAPVLAVFANQVVVPRHWTVPISHATGGLVNGNLQYNLFALALEVGCTMIWAGRLRLSDIGLRARDLWPAVLSALALWTFLNMGVAAWWLLQGQPLIPEPSWTKPLATTGKLIGQLFGNALAEEVLFRGFLTVQLIILFRRFGRFAAVAGGVSLAQAIFALVHIPMLVRTGVQWRQMPSIFTALFVVGVMLACIYLVTRNLFVAVGAHALNDAATLIFPSPSHSGSDFDLSLSGLDVSDLSIPLTLLGSLAWWTIMRIRVRSQAMMPSRE
jgi:membrane protease YdiL (CAAX protease family)